MSFHNREDIYETEDIPSAEITDSDQEFFESDEIEKVHFDVSGAMRRFENCYLDAGGVGEF